LGYTINIAYALFVTIKKSRPYILSAPSESRVQRSLAL